MDLAIEVSRQRLPANGAYSVGAVIVDESGYEISRGYSRETDAKVHAEESALAKLLDTWHQEYNTRRPHRSLNRAVPAAVYTTRPKASPAGSAAGPHETDTPRPRR